MTRVQEAEAEFSAAQAGITDQTPLAQAAEQFNAAAVALEMAWLQLLGDSGCLSDAQQEKAAKAVETYTTTLQKALADAGYYEADVDGVYGPKTVAAVEALQKANGLPQTGTVDKATEKALRTELAAKGGAAAQQETASTAAVQQTLKLAGYWDGPVDGVWTDALTSALEALQKDLGVKVTGTVDAATVAALEKAIADAGQSASPSRSPSVGESQPVAVADCRHSDAHGVELTPECRLKPNGCRSHLRRLVVASGSAVRACCQGGQGVKLSLVQHDVGRTGVGDDLLFSFGADDR